MRILVAQLNPIVGDLEGNTRKIIQTLEQARSKKIDLILFSELIICGYPPEDLLLHSSFIEENQKCLEKIIEASSKLMVVLGVIRRHLGVGEKPLYNSAAIIEDGKLLGFEDKRLLPTYDVFDERRYFEPGKELRIWEFKGRRIAVLICEDIWQHPGVISEADYSCDPVLGLQSLKPDLVLNLSASPYHFEKPKLRINTCSECAKTLDCPVILCAQVGANDQLVFDGYSVYVDRKGQLLQLAKGFEEDQMMIDLEIPHPPCHFSFDPIEDLYQALVIGVRDYFHKQGFKKGCLGLSGGIDSALVACIAVDALGKENIVAVTMPSPYSSVGSVTDSEVLAKNLGISLLNIPIEHPFQSLLEVLRPYFEGHPIDVTEENMQARIRGLILMAISNKQGYLVLNTGNKSELGMGYCTLYGDMVGGLGVISDVTKQQVYKLSNWVNRQKEIIPRSIIEKAPSAELKIGQKDTDSLPDYEIVDRVLQGYVEKYLSPEEIAQKTGIALAVVEDLVHRIQSAEYKRCQAAPGIRVSKKAFRVGRRYPIVQGWI